MLKIIQADGEAERRQIADMRARAAETGEGINATAAAVLKDVREGGYKAVERYSMQFDKAAPREITKEEVEAAYAACPQELIEAMETAAENIRDYNEKLLPRTIEWHNPAGGTVGRIVRGLTRVGIYVPGGTAAYPSTVLMDVIPAKVAGVSEIVMTTPAGKDGRVNPVILAAAATAGVTKIFKTGGAQAVAALAYGTQSIPAVDKIVGPGNIYVATAKRKVFGKVGKMCIRDRSSATTSWPRTATTRTSTSPHPVCGRWRTAPSTPTSSPPPCCWSASAVWKATRTATPSTPTAM